MFENVIKYENEHPDVDWSGEVTYCKVCGDIIIHINGEPANTCSCMCAYIGDNGCAGSALLKVDTVKNSKYMATINNKGIPSSDMVTFGSNFKKQYLEDNNRHEVVLQTIKPKNTSKK